MNVLILGATGFIGSVITAHVVAEGHAVTGLGRNPKRAALKQPGVRWLKADLAAMTRPEAWREILNGQQAVINCAGALQDGLSDNLAATQADAMLALYAAAGSSAISLVVQVSARTDGATADLPFLATKRQADIALASSGLPYVILRPALVLGRNAHGGSALLRALAAFPCILPLIHAESPAETVAADDVAATVARALAGAIPAGTDMDLAAGEPTTLSELVRLHRAWLGLPPAPVISIPPHLAAPVTWLADIAGKLGWRSPLRSTAMKVMAQGVRSSPPAGNHFASAAATLAANPSGLQDLWFARLYLLKPLAIGGLSIFWLLSGIIPLLAPQSASLHFLPFMSTTAATVLTVATCLIDIALGLTVLIRPLAARALPAMIAVSLAYLAGGSLLEPALWLDPLGPLVKVIPSIVLTLITIAILDER